jgi:hypothetical protein
VASPPLVRDRPTVCNRVAAGWTRSPEISSPATFPTPTSLSGAKNTANTIIAPLPICTPSASPDGPITVAPPTAAAIPYGGGNSIPVAAGPVFSGSPPLFDIGFVAITPNGSPTIVAPESCSCTPVPGCPE